MASEPDVIHTLPKLIIAWARIFRLEKRIQSVEKDIHDGITIVRCCEFTVGSEYVVSDCSNATVLVLTMS